MGDSTLIVTGGNSGIGKGIALKLAQDKDNRVVIVSRSPQRGEAALSEIRGTTGSDKVELVVGDLGSIRSARQLASDLMERYPRIDALINNAGIMMGERIVNEDGLETTFMVNHMGPFILSNLLLPRLMDSAAARIVNVNSKFYYKGTLDLQRTPYGDDFSRLMMINGFGTYLTSKLCNMLFTIELARRIEGSGVTANAVHPGTIRTNMGNNVSGMQGMMMSMMKVFLSSAEKGARPPVWLATSPDVQGVNGKYFDLQKESDVVEAAKDTTTAKELWDLSAKLAGLKSDESLEVAKGDLPKAV